MAQNRLFTESEAPHLTEYYKKHLASTEWKEKRRAVWKRSQGRCEKRWGTRRCPNGARDVHHLTYVNFGNEKLETLQHLCPSCHQWEEAEKRETRKRNAVCTFAAKKHGLNWPDTWDYYEMEEEFDAWLDRSGAA